MKSLKIHADMSNFFSKLTNLKFSSRFKYYNGELGLNPHRIKEFFRHSLNLIKLDKKFR